MVKNCQGYTMLGVILMILLIALSSVVFISEITVSVSEEQIKQNEKLEPIAHKNYVLRYLYYHNKPLTPTNGWVEVKEVQLLKYRILEEAGLIYFDVYLFSHFDNIYRAIITYEKGLPIIVKWGKIDEEVPVEMKKIRHNQKGGVNELALQSQNYR